MKALQFFSSAMRKNPNSIEAKLGYARCSNVLGATNESKKYYTEILNRDSKNLPAVNGLAEILLKENKTKDVQTLIEPIIGEFPNHEELRITEAKLYVKLGKVDTAIFKLTQLNEKLNRPKSLEFMLGELHFIKGEYSKSYEYLSRYTNLAPDDPKGFVSKAKLLLYENYFHPNRLFSILPEVEENLSNALTIEPKHEEARFLKVFYEMISAHSGRSNSNDFLRSAFRTIYELAREFPDNKLYHTLEATIAWDLKEDRFASFHYRRALQIDDLDEMLRFESEEYVLDREKEEAKLRRELGKYRRERFLSEKQSLHPKSSLFHLFRARSLSGQTPALRRDLLDFYDANGESILFINLLLRIRDEAPNQFSLENKLEFAVQKLKTSLEYKEGYIQIEPNQILDSTERHSPEVFIFDLESMLPFPNHLRAGRLLAQGLKIQFQQIQSIRIPKSEEDRSIREKLKETNFHPFSNTIPFSIDSLPALDIQRRNKSKIRYVLHGRYSYENHNLVIHISLYDRLQLKDVFTLRTNQKGRDSLSTILARIAERVKAELPREGKVLKVQQEGLIISLGKDDGIVKDSKVKFLRNGEVFLEGKIIEMGKSISFVQSNSRGWERIVATGDSILIEK